MATGTAATDAREYHQSMVHYLRKTVDYEDTDSAGVKVGTLPSGAVMLSVDVMVTTAFAGTSPDLTVGVSGDLDKYLASGDVTETSTGLTSVTDKCEKVSADTEVRAAVGGSSLTAGEAVVIVRYAADNG